MLFYFLCIISIFDHLLVRILLVSQSTLLLMPIQHFLHLFFTMKVFEQFRGRNGLISLGSLCLHETSEHWELRIELIVIHESVTENSISLKRRKSEQQGGECYAVVVLFEILWKYWIVEIYSVGTYVIFFTPPLPGLYTSLYLFMKNVPWLLFDLTYIPYLILEFTVKF